LKKREKSKERFINLVFKMDVDPTCNPKMVIYPNDENQLGCRVKVVDENNQGIESVLCEMQGFYQGDKRDRFLFTQPANGNQFRANILKSSKFFPKNPKLNKLVKPDNNATHISFQAYQTPTVDSLGFSIKSHSD